MMEQLYKNSLNFQTFNEGSFVIDYESKEILLSQELSAILQNNGRKSYGIKEFFDEFVLIEDYEKFVININTKLEKFDRNIFFENIKIKDSAGIVSEFTIKGRVYGDIENIKIVGEVFEKDYYIGDRPILMTVLNTMPDSIVILKNNIIFFANIPAIKLFGYNYPKEIIGQEIYKHIESEDFEDIMKKYGSNIEMEDRFDEKIIDLNSNKYDVDISVASIDDDLVMLTIRDISQRKSLERENKDTTATITKMKSNLKVTQEKLVSQEKMAGIGQLATGIVHEIFNPLGFVMSNFATLKTYFNDIKYMVDEINQSQEITKERIQEIEEKCDIEFILEDINDLFSDVEEGILRINGIILNLKKFSRQEIDEFIEYDINEGIQSTLIVAKNEYKYIADIVTTLDTLPYTKANASKINQVLLNLIINASHAIKEKGENDKGLITIKTFSNDGFIICEIEDSGVGMTSDVYDEIFQPFYTTKPVGIGTGLGLSISYDIITKQHGGVIDVESEKGKGSKFTIKIPIVEFEDE